MPDARDCGITALYRLHGRTLRKRARTLLGNADEAEDILQEVFLAMVASPSLHRGEASIFTLLYQMVTHKALDRRRAWARKKARLVFLGPLEAEEARDGHRGGLAQVEAARDLRWVTRLEPPHALAAVRLHLVDGHTQQEVAVVLGVSRKTVVRVLGRFRARGRPRSQ